MSEIKIRRAGAADAPALAALAGEIWREHYTPIIGAEQVAYMLAKFQSAEAMARDMRDGYAYHIAEENGEPMGYMATVAREGHLFLSKLYVKKEHRGRGLARRFLEVALERARETGLPRVRLTVNKQNEGSIAAYRHLGFAVVEKVVADIGGGYVMDDFVLERDV